MHRGRDHLESGNPRATHRGLHKSEGVEGSSPEFRNGSRPVSNFGDSGWFGSRWILRPCSHSESSPVTTTSEPSSHRVSLVILQTTPDHRPNQFLACTILTDRRLFQFPFLWPGDCSDLRDVDFPASFWSLSHHICRRAAAQLALL
ncbi:hypothetical protein TIFTF001_017667 [Ficus carica]|uniref:Uncharacterized protein n=1 Tax=Ficus carica TaxID=3494 RepID=A0AA88AB29_FICCA|nr:hypothetical protein TIFTF001_017667 [Ficus carica]